MLSRTKNESPPPDLHQASDREVLSALQTDQAEQALLEMLRRHGGWVYAAAMRQTPSPAWAQDITQEVFLELVSHAQTLPGVSPVNDWIFRTVRKSSRSALRAGQLKGRGFSETGIAAQTPVASGQNSVWEQLAPLLDEVLASLQEGERQIILLRFFEKKSFSDISVLLDISENFARAEMVRAVEKLRDKLEQGGLALTEVVITSLLVHHAAPAAPAELMDFIATHWCDQRQPALPAAKRAVKVRCLFLSPKHWVGIGGLVLVSLSLLWWWSQLGGVPEDRTVTVPATAGATLALEVGAAVTAIDRAFWLNQPERVAQLVHFSGPGNDSVRAAFVIYLHAAAVFRQSLQASFSDPSLPTQSFTMTFAELLAGQPEFRPGPPLLTANRATDNRFRTHTIVLTNIAGAWKWNWLEAISMGARDEQIKALQRKSTLLDQLTEQIQEGRLTNVTEVIRRFNDNAPAR